MCYFIKHYISFWNQNSKALKFTLCMSQSAPELNRTKQLLDILPCKLNSCLKRKNLISSIFCFPIDNKHRPSGSNLSIYDARMSLERHVYMYVCWQTEQVSKLHVQPQSYLARGIDVAWLATSCKETVICFARLSSLFCSVDLPHGDLMSFR